MDRNDLKEKLKRLTPENREKLMEYAAALKEIKKEISEMLSGTDKVEEVGGDMMHKKLKP